MNEGMFSHAKWIGHEAGRRRITAHGWEYESPDNQAIAVFDARVQGVALFRIDDDLERLEQEAARFAAIEARQRKPANSQHSRYDLLARDLRGRRLALIESHRENDRKTFDFQLRILDLNLRLVVAQYPKSRLATIERQYRARSIFHFCVTWTPKRSDQAALLEARFRAAAKSFGGSWQTARDDYYKGKKELIEVSKTNSRG
jgi:hypothetical protein